MDLYFVESVAIFNRLALSFIPTGATIGNFDGASCHLFDFCTHVDMVTYAMKNTQVLDGYTGLLGASLHWGM
jgi:hypothetical protein